MRLTSTLACPGAFPALRPKGPPDGCGDHKVLWSQRLRQAWTSVLLLFLLSSALPCAGSVRMLPHDGGGLAFFVEVTPALAPDENLEVFLVGETDVVGPDRRFDTVVPSSDELSTLLLVRGRPEAPKSATNLLVRIDGRPDIVLALSERPPMRVVHPVDVAIVVDDSFSMRNNDPDALRIKAIQTFCEQAAEIAVIRSLSVIAFARFPRVLLPPTPPDSIENMESLVADLRSAGSTRMDHALALTMRVLEQTAESRKVVLFLSDGFNTPGRYNDGHLHFRRRGWPIHAIGLSPDVDHATLSRMASDTGGRYRYCPDATALQAAFADAARMLDRPVLIAQHVLGPTVEERYVRTSIDDSLRVVNWQWLAADGVEALGIDGPDESEQGFLAPWLPLDLRRPASGIWSAKGDGRGFGLLRIVGEGESDLIGFPLRLRDDSLLVSAYLEIDGENLPPPEGEIMLVSGGRQAREPLAFQEAPGGLLVSARLRLSDELRANLLSEVSIRVRIPERDIERTVVVYGADAGRVGEVTLSAMPSETLPIFAALRPVDPMPAPRSMRRTPVPALGLAPRPSLWPSALRAPDTMARPRDGVALAMSLPSDEAGVAPSVPSEATARAASPTRQGLSWWPRISAAVLLLLLILLLLIWLMRRISMPGMLPYLALSAMAHALLFLLTLKFLLDTGVVEMEQVAPALAVRIRAMEQRLGVDILPGAHEIVLPDAPSSTDVARSEAAPPLPATPDAGVAELRSPHPTPRSLPSSDSPSREDQPLPRDVPHRVDEREAMAELPDMQINIGAPEQIQSTASEAHVAETMRATTAERAPSSIDENLPNLRGTPVALPESLPQVAVGAPRQRAVADTPEPTPDAVPLSAASGVGRPAPSPTPDLAMTFSPSAPVRVAAPATSEYETQSAVAAARSVLPESVRSITDFGESVSPPEPLPESGGRAPLPRAVADTPEPTPDAVPLSAASGVGRPAPSPTPGLAMTFSPSAPVRASAPETPEATEKHALTARPTSVSRAQHTPSGVAETIMTEEGSEVSALESASSSARALSAPALGRSEFDAPEILQRGEHVLREPSLPAVMRSHDAFGRDAEVRTVYRQEVGAEESTAGGAVVVARAAADLSARHPSATAQATPELPDAPLTAHTARPRAQRSSEELEILPRRDSGATFDADLGAGRPVASLPVTLALGRHSGDWNSSPTAMLFLGHQLEQRSGMAFAASSKAVGLDDPDLTALPFVYLTGHKDFVFSDEEVVNLRRYIKQGGHLWIDDSTHFDDLQFDTAVRRELARLLPEYALKRLPPDFEAMRTGYDLSDGYMGYAIPPGDKYRLDYLEGVTVDGRVAVVYSRNDYGDGLNIDPHTHPLMESLTDLSPAEMQEGAVRMGINLVLYFMSQRTESAARVARTRVELHAEETSAVPTTPTGHAIELDVVSAPEHWRLEPWGDPATLSRANGLRIDFDHGENAKNAITHDLAPSLTLERSQTLLVGVDSHLHFGARLAVALVANDDYYESRPFFLKPGVNNAVFPLDEASFKSRDTDWEYTGSLPAAISVERITLLIYAPESGSVIIRNFRVVAPDIDA